MAKYPNEKKAPGDDGNGNGNGKAFLPDAAPVRTVLKDRPILMMLLELFKCE